MGNQNQITTDQTLSLLSSINYEIMATEQRDDQNIKISSQKTVDAMTVAGATQPKKSDVSGTEAAPQLPAPSDGGLGGGVPGSGSNIAAIIGAILILQAQASSNFYSLEWNQGTQMMGYEIELAPVISNATIASANFDAAATKAMASGELASGIISGAGAVLAIGLCATSVISEFNEAANAGKTVAEDATKTGANLADNALNSSEDVEMNGMGNPKTLSDAADDVGSKFSAGANAAKNTFGQALQKGLKAMSSNAVMGGVQGINMVAQCGTGIEKFYYGGKQAVAQAASGQSNATSKVADQLTKFFDQGYNRTSELNQGTTQALSSTVSTIETIFSVALQGTQKLYS